jgi:general secretion pathway protein A
MYTSYFGFKESPFNLTPDPRYLFLSPHHREALDHLLYGINERKGFIAITGGIGTGKTTLCRALLDQLNESTKSALIFNSFINEKELLEIINQEFGIHLDPGVQTKKEYIDKLNQFLLETFSGGGNAVLLIDEAQNLSLRVLEQIRMLSNLETEKEKLIQIVLVGQSELKELLASSSLRQLNERVMVRYELRPLANMDIQGYVEHRLVVAGGRGNVRFTKSAFKAIYRYSQGNPRRINAVCDRALLIAYAREKYIISQGMVGSAIEEIRGDIAADNEIKGWFWKRLVLPIMLLLILIIVAGFAGWSFREYIFNLFSGHEKMAAIPTRDTQSISMPLKIEKQEATIYLDEKMSLAGLFNLYNDKKNAGGSHVNEQNVGMISFDIEPKYFMRFKKPFRVLLTHFSPSESSSPIVGDTSSNLLSSSRYLLIREVTADGVIVVDADSKEREVSRDFFKSYGEQNVTWIYPYEGKKVDLIKGMSSPDVLKVQKTLKKLGYLLELTGVYDNATFRCVMKFQNYFGLSPDGIVGPRTRAFLYQVLD